MKLFKRTWNRFAYWADNKPLVRLFVILSMVLAIVCMVTAFAAAAYLLTMLIWSALVY